jgi:hypothetical protein
LALASTASANGRNIVVSGDSGGSVLDYAIQAARYEQAGVRVNVAGRCDSACTLYLALPKTNICVGEGAYFRFHSPSADSGQVAAQRFMMRQYPRWVRHWIAANGGLSRHLMTMNSAYARQFLPGCQNSVALR